MRPASSPRCSSTSGTRSLSADAEVTTEANPETVGPNELEALRAGGINRLSLGMQSAVPHVLATLDRLHTPGRALEAVAEARAAGFEQISLDLIYGTPGESERDWQTSLDAVIGADPDHVSAYALVIEPGTSMARRVARGELQPVDEDRQADHYLLAEELLTGAGYHNYEVSNWARSVASRARHNLAYWQGANWWGIGPGAHSHVGGCAGGTFGTQPGTAQPWRPTQPRPGPRGAGRREPADRAGAARDPAGDGCRPTSSPPRSRPGCRGW